MLETLSITEMLAAFIGLYMVAAGTGLLTDRDGYATVIGDLRENTALGIVTSLFVFVLGAVIVVLHNVWTDPLTILVSLFGWGALIEGLVMLAFRRPFLRLVGAVPLTATTMVIFGVFSMLLGTVLLYGGLS